VLAFELLGLHPIVAGFFSGLVLADSITSKVLKDKIKTISYGVFIPTFFVVIGLQTDVRELVGVQTAIPIILLMIVTLVGAKYVSGYLAARAVQYKPLAAKLFAATSLPQLSTTLATAFVAFNLGIIDQILLTGLVLLSVTTVLLSPFLINRLADRLEQEK